MHYFFAIVSDEEGFLDVTNVFLLSKYFAVFAPW